MTPSGTRSTLLTSSKQPRAVARWIHQHVDGWAEDEILINAVLRQLMVVGEAAACLSPETTGRLSDVPWKEIRGFRNQAVHAYFSIDWTIVREVAVTNLPALRESAMTHLRTHFPEIAARLGN